ncbi:MAG: PaaI family thioesterase, partial [Anaerolineae bacterium]
TEAASPSTERPGTSGQAIPTRTEQLVHMFNNRAPIARTFGMRLSYNDQGQAVVDLPYNPGLDHALGGVHGGVYATMLDTAGWFTAAAAHDESCWLATSEMSVHLLLPVERAALRAVGRLIKRGRRQDIAEMRLYDGEGRLVGHATGTFILLPGVDMP